MAYTWELVQNSLARLRQLPSRSVDLVLTDPPYSSGGLHANSRRQTTNSKYQRSDAKKKHDFTGDNRDQRSWAYWCVLWLDECRRIAKKGGTLLCFADWRQYPSLTDCGQAADWIWRGTICWDKGPSARAPHTGHSRHQAEYLFFASNGKLPHADGRGPFPGVIFCANDRLAKRKHQTAKPLPLLAQLCEFAPPGGVILDPFGGSASAGVAAIQTGREYIGFEREEHYFEVGRKRLVEAAERKHGGGLRQPTLFSDQE